MPNPSVLIVDDSPINVKLMRLLLASSGFAVQTADCAGSARQLLKTFRPDLILMDMQMPEVDGLTLTAELRRDPALASTKIVGCSAYAMPKDEADALAAGCDGYLTKPINTRTVTQQLHGFLAQ